MAAASAPWPPRRPPVRADKFSVNTAAVPRSLPRPRLAESSGPIVVAAGTQRIGPAAVRSTAPLGTPPRRSVDPAPRALARRSPLTSMDRDGKRRYDLPRSPGLTSVSIPYRLGGSGARASRRHRAERTASSRHHLPFPGLHASQARAYLPGARPGAPVNARGVWLVAALARSPRAGRGGAVRPPHARWHQGRDVQSARPLRSPTHGRGVVIAAASGPRSDLGGVTL